MECSCDGETLWAFHPGVSPCPGETPGQGATRLHEPERSCHALPLSERSSNALPRAVGGCHVCTRALTRFTRQGRKCHARQCAKVVEPRHTRSQSALSLIASEFLARELGDISGFSQQFSTEWEVLVSEESREKGRDQERGHHKGTEKGQWRSQARGRTVRCFYCDQEGHIKRDCPKYKAQDQSSDIVVTVVMAVDEDEIDVLLAASEDGKLDWVLDSCSAYHLCRDRDVFSTYAVCEGRVWMANNTASKVIGKGSVRFCMADRRFVTLTEVRHVLNLPKNLISIGMLNSKGCSFDVSGGTLRVFKGNKEMLWGKKTRGLYRLEGSVQIGGASVRHGSNVHDVHREAQRKETKSILRSCTAKGAATPKRVSFALDLISGGDLFSCAHKEREMEPRQLVK
ncbi:hypothetical protein Acr_12g0004940 [Actinidia rufa]|uniref:CCHC-type domain-containing protein n=1 Tax=Actinidia rufa TaxID=165716 RepID=A0A7J0FH85_9ERIC|nr:hypothetical protein Acr_12g0004940 [Actinidia rufa]